MLRTARASASVAGHATEYIPVHREGDPAPVELELMVSVPLTVEDVTGALWWLVGENWSAADQDDLLTDTEELHRMVVELVMALGGGGVEDARLALEEVRPGTAQARVVQRIRGRVRKLYAPVPAPRAHPALAVR